MKYTPATIDKRFSIPLYQRLFEWGESQIQQLLKDLYASFIENRDNPYYIGMLTVYNEQDKYSLVDGQQRFTVLTLIGIALGWDNFIMDGETPRLSFFARAKDTQYLKAKISNTTPEVYNHKMESGLKVISDFLNSFDNKEREEFNDYIHTKTTFFLSSLPKTYNTQDLNRYFEAMNEAGKGLENHEILKVKLLKISDKNKLDEYTALWNAVSEMSRTLIRPKEKEKQADFKLRYFKELNNPNILSVVKEEKEGLDEKYLSIAEIAASDKLPKQSNTEGKDRAILNFSYFLLQVLWLCLPEGKRTGSFDFFNNHKLLETFEKHMLCENPNVGTEKFFSYLLKKRLLFDYFVIRLNSDNDFETNYSINMVGDSENGLSERENIIQYQSMLYVSTQNYIWLTPLLEHVEQNISLTQSDYLSFLKGWDNSRIADIGSLKYDSINRYWFWRLDYYLWENAEIHFSNSNANLNVAKKYLFKQNRSIEHVAPQTPRSESKVIVSDNLLHSFGNLAMISSSQNSSLQNESYEIKMAHVDSYINGSKGGTIESLKLLFLKDSSVWNDKKIISHHNAALGVLINSFPEEYIQIKTELSHLLIKEHA